jgi:F-type H+-transporting ATPase subunit alpha
MSPATTDLKARLASTFDLIAEVLDNNPPALTVETVGTVTFVGAGTAEVEGLPGVRYEEVIRFAHDRLGSAFNVDENRIGVVLLDDSAGIAAGSQARRTGRVMEIPVGEALLGRIVDARGRPLDDQGPLQSRERRPIEQPAPEIMDRSPVTVPLQTGLKVIDALLPIGRGQRELIVGDRQTGKTAVALDTILNQRDDDVVCIYCAVGKRTAAVARVIATLQEHDAMRYSTVVIATEEAPPGLQFVAPYAAMTIGEYFMNRGRDVLLVLDDLTRHARAYRELSLLLRRPPGREAFPGDIFYIHARLLERSTHLKKDHGGGSLTALPIVETEAQNLSAYIPTNLISITDGQIYLSPRLFSKGILPAVAVGKSVSRVGGKTQLAAYRKISGDLRLAYSQFEELESFARFGTRMDEDTRSTLARGRRVREILKQPQYQPLSVPEQIAVLVAVNEGVLDDVALDDIAAAETHIRRAVDDTLSELCQSIAAGDELADKQVQTLVETARQAIEGRDRAGDADRFAGAES